MADEPQKKKKSKVKEEAARISRSFLLGDIMSSSFFNRHKFTILIIIGLFMVYITFKYECQTHMERISTLERELSIVKSESVRERSVYRSRTRESVMQHRIDSVGLRLSVQTQPPYKLTYEN